MDNIQRNTEPDHREKRAKMRNQNPAEKPLDDARNLTPHMRNHRRGDPVKVTDNAEK